MAEGNSHSVTHLTVTWDAPESVYVLIVIWSGELQFHFFIQTNDKSSLEDKVFFSEVKLAKNGFLSGALLLR